MLKLFLTFLFFLCFILGVYLVDTGLKIYQTAIASQNLFTTIMNNQPQNLEKEFKLWKEKFFLLKKRALEINHITGDLFWKKYNFGIYFDLVDKITLFLPEATGKRAPKTYYLLLQNNMELRPTGGFMGSYAKLKFKDGVLSEILIQDIYVPDGQIIGYVKPPKPIEEAFRHGFWRLRDSNWEPDFPKAVDTINWFFEKGGEEKADGMVAVNLLTVKKLLKILGPIYLSDYKQNLNEENFYQIIQSYVETDFFPGSTQKRDILSSVGKAFLEKLKDLKLKELLRVLQVIYQDLEERQILISFQDPILARYFSQQKWDGAMEKYFFNNNLINDYLYLVETNLGANKANCCIERKVEQEIDFSEQKLIKKNLKIYFKYKSGFTTSITPIFPGQDYINFLRVYLPEVSKITKISVDGKVGLPPAYLSWGELKQEELYVDEKKDLGIKGFGFFVVVPPVSEKVVEIEYEMKKPVLEDEQFKYHLVLQKQPGIESFPCSLVLKTSKEIQKIEKEISKDEEIKVTLDGGE